VLLNNLLIIFFYRYSLHVSKAIVPSIDPMRSVTMNGLPARLSYFWHKGQINLKCLPWRLQCRQHQTLATLLHMMEFMREVNHKMNQIIW